MTLKLIPIVLSAVIMTFPIPSEIPVIGSHTIMKEAVMKVAEAAVAPKKSDDALATTIRKMWVTAYASTPEETDDTPFITANGTEVRDGIVATNMLPFHTKVMIPRLFGNKVFTVEDRMHPRKKNFIDVWMPTKQKALDMGIGYLDVVVLN